MLRVFRTVSFRVFAGTLVLLLAAFGVYAAFIVEGTTRQMMAQAREGATRICDLIESSTCYSMLLNRKQDVYQMRQMKMIYSASIATLSRSCRSKLKRSK